MPAEAEADLGGLGRMSGLDVLLLLPPRLVPPWPMPIARGVFLADIACPAASGVVAVAVAGWGNRDGRAEVGDDDEDDEEEDEDEEEGEDGGEWCDMVYVVSLCLVFACDVRVLCSSELGANRTKPVGAENRRMTKSLCECPVPSAGL